MFVSALRRVFSSPVCYLRALLLSLLTITGIGAIFSAGYLLATQDHVADGEDGYPVFELEQFWVGMRFVFGQVVISIPALVVVGGLFAPILSGNLMATIGGQADAAASAQVSRSLGLMASVGFTWLAVYFLVLPALTAIFLEKGTRVGAGMNVFAALSFIVKEARRYMPLMGAATLSFLVVAVVSIPGFLGGVPGAAYQVVVVLPALGLWMLVVDVMTGELRAKIRAEDPYRDYSLSGWHHLRPQHEGASGEGGYLSDRTPETPAE